MEDRDYLLDQWETLQDENVQSQNWAGWGKLLGMGAATLIPGLPLWGAMLAAGVGSRLGSEAGEHLAGHGGVRGGEAITQAGTQSMLRRDLQSTADEAYGDFGTEQSMAAVEDAMAMYSLGGGTFDGNILAQLRGPSNTGVGSWEGLGDTLYDMFKT